MEANIEEPLIIDEIAQHVCISQRQLEQISKQYLNRVPSQYYLELRLNRARQMSVQTSKSIIRIGLSCGFSSGPYFSSAYRNFFGVTPREDRNQRRGDSAFEVTFTPVECSWPPTARRFQPGFVTPREADRPGESSSS